jgi:K+-sensing histidine kinase KdpD
MVDVYRKKLRRVTVVYWIMLLYIIAALVWWYLSLQQQNNAMYRFKKSEVSIQQISILQKQEQLQKIEIEKQKNSVKYISEGCFFLLLIIIGAVFIYRSVRRQFQLQLQQQNFVMAITHELKTPLAITKLNLETLKRYNLDEEKQKKMLDISLQETMRLDTLINNVLISAQLDTDAYKPAKDELDFSDLATDVLKNFQNRYPDRKIISEIEQNTELNGDAILLNLLISNLLENANKYAPQFSAIKISISKINSGVQLNVVDEGKGIDNEHKHRVFEKFYRIGNEQTRNTKGTGLGLYICKKIAEVHNATIKITDNKPQGSNFEVRFTYQ